MCVRACACGGGILVILSQSTGAMYNDLLGVDVTKLIENV